MTDDTTAGPIPTDYADRAKGMGVCLIDGGAAF